MTKTFLKFIKVFGVGYKLPLSGLFFLSIINGLFEVMGIMLIFPLIALVNNPNVLNPDGRLAMVGEWVGLEDPTHLVFALAIAIGLIFIFKNVFMIVFQYLHLTILQKWRNDICRQIMERYLSAPFSYHLGRSSSEMINTLNSTASYSLNSFIFSGIMMVSNTVVAVMLLGFMLFNFFIPSLVSGALLIGLMTLQARYLKKESEEIDTQITKSRAANLSVMSQAIMAVKETKAFGKESYFYKSFDTANRVISRYDKKSAFLQYIPMYISEVVLVLAIICMVCLVLAGAYSPAGGVGSLAILAAVAFRMAPVANRSLSCYSQMRVSAGATSNLLDEIHNLNTLSLEKIDEVKAADLTFKNTLRLENVSFSYDSAPALHDINLEIKKGEFIGIVGASGAGKTTLVDLILGLLRIDEGQYFLDGKPIKTFAQIKALRLLTGYVSQNPYIFNGSIAQNIAFGIKKDEIDKQRVIDAAKLAQLGDFLDTKENTTEYMIGDSGKGLSGGQRQRLAIARAVYYDPEIIVLDEATSALDVETEYEITQVINRLKRQKTIIAIAHRLSTLKECDRLIYMDKGKIVDVGTFQELNDRHSNFSRILELSSLNVSN